MKAHYCTGIRVRKAVITPKVWKGWKCGAGRGCFSVRILTSIEANRNRPTQQLCQLNGREPRHLMAWLTPEVVHLERFVKKRKRIGHPDVPSPGGGINVRERHSRRFALSKC